MNNQEKLDIVIETPEGLHITLASVQNQAYGVLVAEALYSHLHNAPRSSTQARYIWLRRATASIDFDEPHSYHLLQAWPDVSRDPDGNAASVAAWKASPRGVSGDESEPDELATRQQIAASLARLPQRYQPQELTVDQWQRYTLRIDRGMILRDKYAREAIRLARAYVDEHERSGWKLPTGVVNGIYD